MRTVHLFSLFLVAAGLGLLALGLPREGGELYFVVIFPVFVLRGPLSTLGAFALFFGLFLGFFSFLPALAGRSVETLPPWPGSPPPGQDDHRETPARPRGEDRSDRRFGGVLFLGPIPIVFGSNGKVTTAMLLLALAVTVLLLVLFL